MKNPLLDRIDLLVCVAGINQQSVEAHLRAFIDSLKGKCDTAGLNVFLVMRDAFPMSALVKEIVASSGFSVRDCPLPRGSDAAEDTARACDWMVNNLGESAWVAISHYDIEFV